MKFRLPFRPILALALLAGSTGLLSADTASSYAVYRSEDRGQSWTRADAGLPPQSRINAFAQTRTGIVAGTDSGIFLSTHHTQSWQPAPISGGQARVTSLATIAGQFFAGTSQGTLLSSSNQGATWQPSSSYPRRNVRSLHAIDQTLYVGTDADHVYRSSDHGQTWTHLVTGLPPHPQIFALTSVNGHLFAGLYAQGLYTWNEPGQKWLRVGEAAEIRPLALASVGRTLIAGHNPGGIYWSDNLGQTWRPWSHSANPAPVPPAATSDLFPSLNSILSNPISTAPPLLQAPIWEMADNHTTASNLAIAGAGNAIYLTTDYARTWTRATNGLPLASPGIAFLINGDFILAAIHQNPSLACAAHPVEK